MRPLHLAVAVCLVGWSASAPDPYAHGVFAGAALAVAGAAAIGLAALAIKHKKKGGFYNYGGYGPYHGGYGGHGGYGHGGYGHGGYNGYHHGHGGGYSHSSYYHRRRRSMVVNDDTEQDFEKIMSQDRGQCGMRVVCELEARAALGDGLDDFSKLIISLFGSDPAPVPTSALDTAQGRYNYAAYIGSKSSLKTCAELYSTCQFSSKSILQLVEASQQQRQLAVTKAPVQDVQ